MEALSRQEYPAILVRNCRIPSAPLGQDIFTNTNASQERLHPSAAAAKLNERVKRIGRVNTEIADWLQVHFIRAYWVGQIVETLAGTSESRTRVCDGS